MEFQHGVDRLFALDGQGELIAEITYPVSGGRANLNHTFVDNSLRGQGVAAMLVEIAAKDLRARGLKADVTCAYAQKWLAQHPEYSDVLR